MMFDKKINIYVPTYNSENTIEKSILSILNQSYKNFTLTVIDNCSSDNTIKILKNINDKRIKIVCRKKNFGVINNLNYAFSISEGDFAAVYHSNDIYHRDILRKQLNLLKKNPDIKITFCNAYILGSDGKHIDVLKDKVKNKIKYDLVQVIRLLLKHYNFFVCQSAFFKPSFYKKNIKKWDYKFGMSSDLDLWLRFLTKTKVIFLKDILVKTTIGKSQASYTEKNKIGKSDFFKVLNHHIKKNQIELKSDDIKNLKLLLQRDMIRQIINFFILKNYKMALKLSKKINLFNLFFKYKISKKICLIIVIKYIVILSSLVNKNLLRKIIIFINEKYIT